MVVTGCAATAGAKYGYLSPEILDSAGPGLREVWRPSASRRCCTWAPAWTTRRILTVLTQMATEGGLGDDISDIPAVGICPEWMCEKAIAIGTYCVASGAYVLFGVNSPVKASSVVTELIYSGWEKRSAASWSSSPTWSKIFEKSLAHIDAKRAALKLAALRSVAASARVAISPSTPPWARQRSRPSSRRRHRCHAISPRGPSAAPTPSWPKPRPCCKAALAKMDRTSPWLLPTPPTSCR